MTVTDSEIAMSIQWTIAASFLYAEIVVVLLLVLPIASPRRWQSIFRSRFLGVVSRQASWYFFLLLFILMLFLLDAIREMKKYSNAESGKGFLHAHQLDLEMQVNMRLFRAQRNFYISGFALFLSFVIRRLVILISTLATMQAQNHAALQQAANATSMAKGLISSGGAIAQNVSNEGHDKEVKELKSEISELKKELEAERLDKETLKKQAESLNKEYDRLNEEYNKLDEKVSVKSSGDKKDN